MLLDFIRSKKDEITALGAQYGYSNFRVFGSVARGEETTDSDIDFLADYRTPPDPDKQGWGSFDFDDQLAQLLGRRVDVVTTSSAQSILYKYIRDDLKEI